MMKRKDREICDKDVMESIICQANVCRLAFCDGFVPYVVPLCFGYCQGVIYFHAAKEGRKLEILSKNSKVCFEIDIDQEQIRSQDHCSMRYRSVIGFGTASIVVEKEEKVQALDQIMRHYHQEPSAYSEATLERTAIIKVNIEDMTGKACGY
jgi:uncharacterized protein